MTHQYPNYVSWLLKQNKLIMNVNQYDYNEQSQIEWSKQTQSRSRVFLYHVLVIIYMSFVKIKKINGSIRVRSVAKNYFHFSRKCFQRTELSFHFQFSMKIFENAFGWNGEIFIFHFKKLENALRKSWKTKKISFLTCIKVRKQKIFIFLENLWKLNEPNAFSKFSFSLKIFPEKLKKFRQLNAPLFWMKIN